MYKPILGRTLSPGLVLAWHKYMLGLLAKVRVVGGKVISLEFPITKILFYKNFLRRQSLNYLWNRKGAVLFHLCGHLICFSTTFHWQCTFTPLSSNFTNRHMEIRCFYICDFFILLPFHRGHSKICIFKATYKQCYSETRTKLFKNLCPLSVMKRPFYGHLIHRSINSIYHYK